MVFYEDPVFLICLVGIIATFTALGVLLWYESSEDEKLYDQLVATYPEAFKTPSERTLLLLAIKRWSRRIVLKLING